jgi:cysteinyl-tRNA synthetase
MHLGNMRAYVFADILQRVLRTKYETVTHVINITDVGHLVGDGDDGQDKLEKGAAREGKTAWEIAKFYTDAYMHDLKLLNIDTDNFTFPRATDYIKQQIKIIEKLERGGYTYTTSDGVYFDTSKWDKYADFAKIKIDALNAGERVDMGEKKNKTDFALWKFSPKGEQRQMEWIYSDDRAGTLIEKEIKESLTKEEKETTGFPGWHIECSAMSEALLGKNFDIHTGGIDHIPVHHTNEIAQSECAHNGEKFVNYWCHVNFLNDKTGKMSKSNDDFLRLQTLVDAGYNPAAYRYLLLTTHYRKELEFSYESLDAAQTALKKLSRYMYESAKVKENIIDATKFRINDEWYAKFLDAMYDDMNTSRALAIIWEMINEESKFKKENNTNDNKSQDKSSLHAYSTILKMNKVLGLDLSYSEEVVNYTPEALALIEKRKIARSEKDWATSDALRAEIQALGFEVVD